MSQNLRKPANNFTQFTQGCVKIYVGLRRFTQVYAGLRRLRKNLRRFTLRKLRKFHLRRFTQDICCVNSQL